MSKKKKQHPRNMRRPLADMPPEPTASSQSVHPDATLSPDVSDISPTSSNLLSNDSTNAPAIGQSDDDRSPYAKSNAELVDKYVFGRLPFTYLLICGIIGYIFIQDNSAAKLTDWKGILWTMMKSSVLLGIFFTIWLAKHTLQKYEMWKAKRMR
jgi:hypothetical protein